MDQDQVSGLPNVQGLEQLDGVSEMVTDKVQPEVTQQVPQNVAKAEAETDEIGLEQFKNPKDLLKSYKEIQGFVTRMAQENKALKDNLAKIQEQQELMRFQQMPQQNPRTAAQPQKDFDSMFIENPQMAVASVASQTVQQQMLQARIAEALEEEHIKNPSEYQERFSYAQQLSNQYPQLTQSAPGIRKLFEMADKYRKEDYQKKGMAFVKAVIGEDADFEKFKALLAKDESGGITTNNNRAYMPDTSNSSRSRTGTEAQKPTFDTEIQAGVAKGDVDSVIANVFKRALQT